jgi:hypothetical protein
MAWVLLFLQVIRNLHKFLEYGVYFGILAKVTEAKTSC